jgi:hypothetical protein
LIHLIVTTGHVQTDMSVRHKHSYVDMASDTLKQWQSTQDASEHLTLHEIPIPDPGDDEVLVKISSVSLNYRDTEGTYDHVTAKLSLTI